MSISPPTDIVLDVTRAANPQAYREAAARLGQTAPASQVAAVFPAAAFGPTDTAADTFSNIFNKVGAVTPGPEMFEPPSPLIQMPFDATAALTHLKNQTTFASTSAVGSLAHAEGVAPTPAGAVKEKAYQNFEAMVLSSFVETMLPQNADATFGAGTAGEIWRSMLAQQIATQMAAAGGIGIAAQLRSSETPGGRTPSLAGLL